MSLFSWFGQKKLAPSELLEEMIQNIDYRGTAPLGAARKPKWQLDQCPEESVVYLNLEKVAPLMAQALYDDQIHKNEPTKMINLAEAARAGTPLPLPRGGALVNAEGLTIADVTDGRHRLLFSLSRGCTEIPIHWLSGDKQPMIDAGYIRNPTAAELEALQENSPAGAYHEKHIGRQRIKDCVKECLTTCDLEGLQDLARRYALYEDPRITVVEAAIKMMEKTAQQGNSR